MSDLCAGQRVWVGPLNEEGLIERVKADGRIIVTIEGDTLMFEPDELEVKIGEGTE